MMCILWTVWFVLFINLMTNYGISTNQWRVFESQCQSAFTNVLGCVDSDFIYSIANCKQNVVRKTNGRLTRWKQGCTVWMLGRKRQRERVKPPENLCINQMNTKHGYTCIYRLNTMTQSEEAKKQKNWQCFTKNKGSVRTND